MMASAPLPPQHFKKNQQLLTNKEATGISIVINANTINTDKQDGKLYNERPVANILILTPVV